MVGTDPLTMLYVSSIPSDLRSKAKRILKKPEPPTLAEMIVGEGRTEPSSPEQREGARVAAVLATRQMSESAAALEARRKAEADTERARIAAFDAEYNKRLREAR